MQRGKMQDTDATHDSLVRLFELVTEEHGLDLSPSELARFLGESAQTIHNWGGPRGVSKQGAEKLQAHHGWSSVWIRHGKGPKFVVADDKGTFKVEGNRRLASYSSIAPNKGIPVIAELISTDSGELVVSDIPPAKRKHLTAYVHGARNVFAVLVRTEALMPRYRPDEVLLVDASHKVEAGNDVIVYLHRPKNHVLVKQLNYRRGSHVSLGGVGAAGEYRPTLMDESEIKGMCPIVSAFGVQFGLPGKDETDS